MERALQAVLDSIAGCCCQPVKRIYQQTVAACVVEHDLLQVGLDSICFILPAL
jgi:aryl carrier-like protein